MSSRKIIDQEAEVVSAYELGLTLENLALWVNNKIAEHGGKSRLDWQPDHWYAYDNSATPRFVIFTPREETDEEYAARQLLNAKHAQAKLDSDRAELIRLQKLFPNGV